MGSQTTLKLLFLMSILMLMLSVLICIRSSRNGHNTCVYSPVSSTFYCLTKTENAKNITFIESEKVTKGNYSEIRSATGSNTKYRLDGKPSIVICGNQLYSVIADSKRKTFCFKNSLYLTSICLVIKILLLFVTALMFCSKEFPKLPELSHSRKIVDQCRSRNLQQHTLCYPYSIGKYFNDIDKSGSLQQQKLMNYEWARLCSFKSFPKSSDVSSIRLAQSGFYYSGMGTEAICFCCGLRNDLWNPNETVHAIHTRLSPDCKFVKGEQTNNESIHGESKPKEPSDSDTDEERQPAEGATGGPEDVQTENKERYRNEIPTTSEVGHYIHNDRNEIFSSSELGRELPNNVESIGVHNSLASSLVQETSNHSERNIDQSKNFASYGNLGSANRFPGIINEQPRHPDYATRGARLTSFTGWPSSTTLQPEALSTAGFFYAGIKDCVRCFFCGSGMTNWEHGDNPWIEHARWSPNCAYVKHCKGDNFVAMCQRANTQISMTTGAEGSEVLNSQETIISEDSLIEDLNSSAATKIIDMGYTQTQVEDAIKKARQTHGKTELKAQILLEFLLENDLAATISSSKNSSEVQKLTNGDDKPVPKSHAKIKTDEQRALREENQQLKEQMMCKICMDKDANIVFLPCGHMVSCIECAHALRKCAVCRKIIQGTVRTYPS